MTARFSVCAHWHSHINAVQAPLWMVDWLTSRASLTARLLASSETFRVQRLHQHRAMCLRDEFEKITLRKRVQVMERDVLLRCNETPVVYAHTVLPLSATAQQWPLFATLGNRSLGTTLFDDPLVERGALEFARLRPSHALVGRIANLGLIAAPDERLFDCLFARRSVFKRKGASLLVTEVFLPSLVDFSRVGRDHLPAVF
ncbi:MAG: chorismate lyase [Undibacterium sp.]|nr:chorismate lyase [Undibacterium sp.]